MATFSQLPGDLDVTFVAGDEVNISIILGVDITGYAIETKVLVGSTQGFQGGGGGTITGIGATVAVPTIQVTNATTGAIIWSITETQTASMSPGITYLWYLRWITPGTIMTRTILAGEAIVRAPGA